MSDVQSGERVHYLVTGQVQGVGFRAFAQLEAKRSGLTGWVRNGRDGRTVEIVAEGPTAAIRAFTTAITRGPSLARVTDVRRSYLGGSPEFADFAIRS